MLTLFHVRGIPIRAHWTLLLVLPYLALAFSVRLTQPALPVEEPIDLGMPPLLLGLIVALGLFVSVAIHELGHSLVAVRFGCRVRDITLMLLGGMSRFERMPRRPWVEALVSAVGPATSLALAAALFLVQAAMPAGWIAARVALSYLAGLNLVVGVFNLLPAFPLDGGRIFRALLAVRIGHARATAIAAWTGKAAAVLLAALGLVGPNILLLLIALFLYTSAGAEGATERAREALSGLRIADLLFARPPVVTRDLTLAEVLEWMRATGQSTLIVTGGREGPRVVSAADVVSVPAAARAALRLDTPSEKLLGDATVIAADAPAEVLLDPEHVSGHLIVIDASGAAGPEIVGLLGPTERATAIELALLEARARGARVRPSRRGRDRGSPIHTSGGMRAGT
jgi:Zn-dependent protease